MSLFARSLVLIAAWLPLARATTITIMPATNASQAASERDAWLAATFGAGTRPQPVEVDVDRLPSHGNSDVTKFQLLTSFYSLYFLMTGVDANVQIQTADGTKKHIHPADDDGLYFVGITSSAPIGSIQWRSSDYFRLTNFGIPQSPAPAPEMPTWLAVALGLIAIKRRCRVPSAPSPDAP